MTRQSHVVRFVEQGAAGEPTARTGCTGATTRVFRARHATPRSAQRDTSIAREPVLTRPRCAALRTRINLFRGVRACVSRQGQLRAARQRLHSCRTGDHGNTGAPADPGPGGRLGLRAGPGPRGRLGSRQIQGSEEDWGSGWILGQGN